MNIRYADRLQVELESAVHSSAAVPEWQSGDVRIEQVIEQDRMKIYLTADRTPVEWIALRWVFSEEEKPIRMPGNADTGIWNGAASCRKG